MNEQEIRLRVGRVSPSGLWLGALCLAVLGVCGVSAVAQEPSGQEQSAAGAPRTDGQIEMDVVHTLDAAPELKDDWITAGTVQGEVTLSGTSGSEANRALAEQIAGKVAGVTKVVNNLKVGDPQTAQDNVAQAGDQQQAMEQEPANAQGAPSAEGAANAPAEPQMGQGAQAENGSAPNVPVQGGNRPAYQPMRPAPPQYSQQNSQQGQYAQQGPEYPEGPRAPVTVAQGQLLKVRTAESLTSQRAKDGEPVEFTVVRDVYSAGVLAIPRGATIRGTVVDVKKAGRLGGSADLGLRLTSLDMGGQSYPLDCDLFNVRGPNKTEHTVSNAIGGALMGALIGGAVGGGGGAAIGAAAGGATGTAASAATPGPQVWIPAEAMIDFHLNSPLTVTPVSRGEARRLAGNVPPGPQQRPTLYRRGYPYGYPPPPGNYAPNPY